MSTAPCLFHLEAVFAAFLGVSRGETENETGQHLLKKDGECLVKIKERQRML